MSCLHPIKAIYMKKLPGQDAGKVIFAKDNLSSYPDNYEDDYMKVIFVPCGKCSGCAVDYSNYWSTRCLMESLNHEHCAFITLTYNDGCCPKSVSKKDCQNFLKRLRRRLEKDNVYIRYFLGAEYGGQTLRPHYHAILFGVDLFKYGAHKLKDGLYKSDLLAKAWPFGFNSFSDANAATIKYVCKYSIKRCTRTRYEKNELIKRGYVPEFSLKSTHPALGTAFYAELVANDTLLKNGGTFYLNGNKVFLPKLFFHKLKESLNDEKLFESTIDSYILKGLADEHELIKQNGVLNVGSVRAERYDQMISNKRKKI